MPTIRKAMAYITRGNELLIFRQPDYPEAGLQVPGGTIEDGGSASSSRSSDDDDVREIIESL